MFHFLRNCQPVFQSDYTILISHWQKNGSFCFSTSLSTFGIVSVLDFGHSNRCIVVSHFNLQFSNDVLSGTSFHMVANCMSLVRYLFRSLTHFLIFLLLLSLKNSLYFFAYFFLLSCFLLFSFESSL